MVALYAMHCGCFESGECECPSLQTLTKSFDQKLDGNYAWMLHAVLNKPSKLEEQDILKCKDKLIKNFLLWIPTHRLTSVAPIVKIYTHELFVDTGCHLDALLKVMDDMDGEIELKESML